MENPKKSCPNGLAQLCGLAQLYGLSKRSQPFFFWKKNEKKNAWTLEMGTYHWDGHIGCFRGIYNVRRQVLFCGVCFHLRDRPKNKNKKKLRCNSNFRKSFAVEKSTSICGNPAGTVHASTRTSKVKIRAVRDARRATKDKRWRAISQRTVEMGYREGNKRYGD